MDNIHTEAAPGVFLGKEVIFAIVLVYHRCGKLFGQKFSQFVPTGLNACRYCELLFQGKGVSQGFAEYGRGLGNELENLGQALNGTADEIDAEDVQQGYEPPGMIHVEKAQLCINLKLYRTDFRHIFWWQWSLGQDGADYGSESQ